MLYIKRVLMYVPLFATVHTKECSLSYLPVQTYHIQTMLTVKDDIHVKDDIQVMHP